VQIEFLPDYSTWEDWNGNILHYYGEQNFPFLPEPQWRDVAFAITLNAVFDTYGIPAPDTFEDWRDWARAFTTSVNGKTF
jgi:hypothetical protein